MKSPYDKCMGQSNLLHITIIKHFIYKVVKQFLRNTYMKNNVMNNIKLISKTVCIKSSGILACDAMLLG